MKRVILLLAISLFVFNCYSQSEASKNILGNWYHAGSNTLNLEINKTISFTKVSSDSLQLEWLFKENGGLTIRYAMLTPDKKGTIKYKSRSATWVMLDEIGELTIKNEGQSQVLKLNTLNADRLIVTRIK